jgi:hypothetical protein
MIINQYKDEQEHPGKQPVRVLLNTCLYYFQNYHSEIVENSKDLKGKGHISDKINIIKDELPILSNVCDMLPFIDNGTINLSEIFLTYLWCICFSIHTPLFEIVHKKSMFENDKILFNECNELRKFASGIKTRYAILDKTKRFNPEFFDEENKETIGNTNGVFINAVNFILCHEYAHAKYQLYNGTKDDEAKADFEAVRLLKEGSKDKNELGNRAVGALIGLGSLLLLSRCVNSIKHPDNDKRIFDFIENLELNDDNNEIWALGCLIFAYWDNEYSVQLDFLYNDLTISYRERFISLLKQ